MANIAVRKDHNQPAARPARREISEPSRMMRALFGWDPFREMEPFFTTPMLAEEQFMPAFDVKETQDGFHFQVDVPGVKEGDINIQANGNRLTISGKRESEEKKQTDTYYTYERSYGSFTRSFTLPDGADIQKAQADLKNGVLSVIVPKKPEQQPKNIEIKTTKS